MFCDWNLQNINKFIIFLIIIEINYSIILNRMTQIFCYHPSNSVNICHIGITVCIFQLNLFPLCSYDFIIYCFVLTLFYSLSSNFTLEISKKKKVKSKKA